MKNLVRVALCLWMVGLGARSAEASAITFVGTQGGLTAAVRITDIGGGLLTVELASFGDAALVPSDVLTGVFFNGITFNPTEISAVTGATASLVGNATTGCVPDPPGSPCPSGANLNVGGEWAGEVVSVGLNDYGISSAGLNLFGGPNFNGPNLSDPVAVNGLNFGLVSVLNGIGAGANAGVTGVPLIQGVVTFTLMGPLGFDPSTGITSVLFNFGTELVGFPGLPLPPGVPTPFDTPPPPAPVPEPGTLILLGLGLAGMARSIKARRR